MIKVAITGGIGVGKTTVSSLFEEMGIPVFNSDVVAKEIMSSNHLLKTEITKIFGQKAYENNKLNKSYLSDAIFNDENLLEKINSIVHPYVAEEFNLWLKNQNSKYIIYESAIVFESKGESAFDKIICVIAPKEEVFRRIIERNNFSHDKIASIMNKQLPQQTKVDKSDYVIENIDESIILERVMQVHNDISNLA